AVSACQEVITLDVCTIPPAAGDALRCADQRWQRCRRQGRGARQQPGRTWREGRRGHWPGFMLSGPTGFGAMIRQYAQAMYLLLSKPRCKTLQDMSEVFAMLSAACQQVVVHGAGGGELLGAQFQGNNVGAQLNAIQVFTTQ